MWNLLSKPCGAGAGFHPEAWAHDTCLHLAYTGGIGARLSKLSGLKLKIAYSVPRPARIIANAPSMQPVPKRSLASGRRMRNVLVTGEHGTGKEVVAQDSTCAFSSGATADRSRQHGGLSEGIFESELSAM